MTAAERAAAAAGRIPDPAPKPRRIKRKSLSWKADPDMAAIRWFRKVRCTAVSFIHQGLGAFLPNGSAVLCASLLRTLQLISVHLGIEGACSASLGSSYAHALGWHTIS